MWNRTLVYLGLREEPEEIYDELPARFVPEDDPYAQHAPDRGERRRHGHHERSEVTLEPELAVTGAPGRPERPEYSERPEHLERPERSERADRPQHPERLERTEAVRAAPVRAARHDPVAVVEDNVRPLRSADGEVRTVSRVAQVEVTTFDDVEAVGARYRTGQAVLFDLSGATGGTPRRVVDFVAGLTYALRGELTKVGARAFLLVPEGARVTAEERRRLTGLGYRLPSGSET